MPAYYNEFDPFAAAWLQELIKAGHIAPGDVDERSITDVRPDDLRGYTQCHFFAGIGRWSYALRLAGWPDDRPVWTGSCPCQPFSAAGKQRAADDERHLWPTFFRLISECRPSIVAGEQVAGAAGLAWLDGVFIDLEAAGYAAAAANLCAAGVGAPHIRQRLYWVAHANGWQSGDGDIQRSGQYGLLAAGGRAGELADAERWPSERRGHDLAAAPRGDEGQAWQRERVRLESGASSYAGHLGNADNARLEGRRDDAGEHAGQLFAGQASPWLLEHASGDRCEVPVQQRINGKAPSGIWSADGYRGRGAFGCWDDLEWLQCSDGKARPTQPGLFPLAHGVPARVGRLRGYGNAIVPQVAAAFIKAVMEHDHA